MEEINNPYANREARIRLTPKCNYRCFFCHEEGGCQAPAAEGGNPAGTKAERRKADGSRDQVIRVRGPATRAIHPQRSIPTFLGKR